MRCPIGRECDLMAAIDLARYARDFPSLQFLREEPASSNS